MLSKTNANRLANDCFPEQPTQVLLSPRSSGDGLSSMTGQLRQRSNGATARRYDSAIAGYDSSSSLATERLPLLTQPDSQVSRPTPSPWAASSDHYLRSSLVKPTGVNLSHAIKQLRPIHVLSATIRQQLATMEEKSKLPYDFKAIVETVCMLSYGLSCLSFLGVPSIVTLPLLTSMGLLVLGGALLTGWRYSRQAKSTIASKKVPVTDVVQLVQWQRQFCQHCIEQTNFREQKEAIFLNMRINLAIGIHHPQATALSIAKSMLRYALLRSTAPFLLSPLLEWLNKASILAYLYRPFVFPHGQAPMPFELAQLRKQC